MRKLFFVLALLAGIGCFNQSNAQGTRGITITGVLLQADSLVAIPFGSISVKNRFRGTVSNTLGHFSIVVQRFDTLEFSAIGFKTAQFVVPDLVDTSYSLIQLLTKETILLKEVEVIAWPDATSFVKAFHSYQLSRGLDDEVIRMRQELDEVLQQQYEKDKFYYDQMRYSKLYNTTGFTPPNNFLNPITWSNFVRDWRNGAFRTNKK